MANQDECCVKEDGPKGRNEEAKIAPSAVKTLCNNRGVQRWRMLSSVVKSKKYNSECQTNNIIISSGGGSNNIDTKRLKVEQNGNDNEVQFHTLYNMMCFNLDPAGRSDWIESHWNQELFPGETLNLKLKMLPKQFSLDEIAGFDNSGNVRLWPCEELLAYLCSFGMIRDRLNGSIVCELGAGMTALAGMISAKHCGIRKIILSDGNERSVENIREIVNENFPNENLPEMEPKIDVRRIRWENAGDYSDLCHCVETIICADCLFVPKYHQHLLNTLDNLLVLGSSSPLPTPTQLSSQATKISSFHDQIYLSAHHHHHHNHHKNHSSTNAISSSNSDTSSGLCDSNSSLSSDSRISNHYDSNLNLVLDSASNNSLYYSFTSSSPSLSSSSASSSTSALFSSTNLCSLGQVFIVAPQRDTTLESFIRLVRLDGRFRCLVLDHFDQTFFSAISDGKPDPFQDRSQGSSNFSISFSEDFNQHPYDNNRGNNQSLVNGFSSRDSTGSSDESTHQFYDHFDGQQLQLADSHQQRPFLLILTRN